ncbi:MAG: hypothetical protein GW861_07060 [Deltaproteobacteria bacterium]|nr:hypothetical protein [Deltaproteobacteria bacterium]
MKCYRCPECGCGMTARPADYFSRIRGILIRWISRYLEDRRRLEALYPRDRND